MVSQVGRNLSFLVVKQDDVDIRAVVQLPATQFSKAEDGELRLGTATPAAQFGIPIGVNFSHANFRHRRKLQCRLLQRRGFGDFAKRNAEHLPAFPIPKRMEVS